MTTKVIAIVVVIEEFGLEGGSDNQNYLSVFQKVKSFTLRKQRNQIKPPLNLPKVLAFGYDKESVNGSI